MVTESILPRSLGLDLIQRLIAEDVIGGSVTHLIIDASVTEPLRIMAGHLGDERVIEATLAVTGDALRAAIQRQLTKCGNPVAHDACIAMEGHCRDCLRDAKTLSGIDKGDSEEASDGK